MNDKVFYYARLVDEDGYVLADEQLWPQTSQIVSLEEVAKDLAGYFESEPHHENPDGKRIEIFGPFKLTGMPQVYAITLDEDNTDWNNWKATYVHAVSRSAGQAIEQAYPFGYRSEDKEP